MKKCLIAITILILITPLAFGKQFYASDFERDTIGKFPQGWDLGFKGKGNPQVIADPLNKNNKVFAHTDLGQDQARHDVGGNIAVVGDANMKDYIVDYDIYFPTDFYMGVLFRFTGENEFYLLDRRQGSTFDFWKRAGGNWNNFKSGVPYPATPEKWFSFRLVIKGDKFEAYAKEKGDKTPFAQMKPLMDGTDATYKTGKFGLYGLVYVDNVIIGETENDMFISVESIGKLTSTWGEIKR
ncbi:TPA: hypothetical protein ENS27_14800 [bacterium]|jgi:hypothetical protein|nr:hypothetical protein [bacterium]